MQHVTVLALILGIAALGGCSSETISPADGAGPDIWKADDLNSDRGSLDSSGDALFIDLQPGDAASDPQLGDAAKVDSANDGSLGDLTGNSASGATPRSLWYRSKVLHTLPSSFDSKIGSPNIQAFSTQPSASTLRIHGAFADR